MPPKPDKAGRISVFDLQVPLNLALGLYERLSDEELEEHYQDIKAEKVRRELANG